MNEAESPAVPYSEDAEKGLLCSLLLEPGKVFALCSHQISAAFFFIPAHAILFDIISEWPKPDSPIDFVWLRDQLANRDQLAEVGDKEALDEFYEFIPTAANAEYYIKVVAERYALRRLIATCRKTIDQCQDHAAQPAAILKDVATQLAGIAHGVNGAAQKIYIELMSPSKIAAYQPPRDLVLIGDCHITRGAIFVLGGPPGVGKSRASIALAQSGATGHAWFGYATHTRFRTMIIQNENGLFRLQRELADIADLQLEDYLRISPPPPYGMCFWKTEFRDQLRRYYESWGPQIALIDPWNSVARDDRMKDYLESCDIIRDVFTSGDDGPALGIIAHIRKPTPGERSNGRALLNLLAGSYVLGSVPRMVFVLQHASDDVTEDRVVLTCCKNNDGQLGERSAWVRQNGLFTPVTDFDWEAWDSGEKESEKIFPIEEIAKILAKNTKGLAHAKLAREIANHGVSRRTAYRRIEEAEKSGLIKFHKGKDVYVLSTDGQLCATAMS